MKLEHRAGWTCATLGLIFVLGATLTPLPGGAAAAASMPFWCLVCGTQGGVDVTLNVILFIPFALGLRIAGQSSRRVVLLSALLSIFVESMQISVIVGRDTSLSDLLTNTTGGVIGAALGTHLRTIILPRASVAKRLARMWAAVWLAILVGSAWLVQPWSPQQTLRVDWSANVPSYAVFSGRVLTADGDLPPYPGPVADSLALPKRLAAGNISLSFEAVVGPSQADRAPIVALLSDGELLGAAYEVGDDIVLELPTNAARLRLRNPALRLDHGRSRASGEPVQVTAGAREQTLWIASSYGGGRRYRELALSPSFGWSLLLPFEYALGPEIRLLTGLWIAGLLLPLGYWVRRGWPGRWPQLRVAAGLGAVVAIGLGAIPRLTGYPPVHWSEWLAAATGLALGWTLASRVTYLAERCASPSTSESCSS